MKSMPRYRYSKGIEEITMIERVTQAIIKASTPTDKAKAAIETMREPTVLMIMAPRQISARLDYIAMIDAALKE